MDFFALKPLTSLPPPAFSDAAGAQSWLSQQRKSPGRFFDAAVEQLERLQGLADPGFTRAQILETLRHDTLVALAANRQRFAWQPRPLKAVASAALNANLRLWSAMSTGYLQCTEGLASTPGTDPAWVAVAAHRAMTAVKLAIEDHFFAGAEPPALLWQRALAIAQMTQAFGIADLPVTDPCMPDLGQSTSMHQYGMLALTAFGDPFGMNSTEYAMLQRLLIRWRDLPKLAATRGGEDKERWIDLRQLEQPAKDALKDPAWMEISLVRAKIKKRAEALETGDAPESLHLGKDLSGPQWIALLNRVRRKWRESYELPTPHQAKADEPVFLTATVEDGFGLITGFRYNANPKAGAASDKVLHDRMAIFGRNSIISDLASEKPKLGEEWAFGFEDDNGLRISSPADAVRLGLLVGQLVTIKRGNVPQVGKVTRAVTRQNGRMEASILLFHGAPVAAESHLLVSGGQQLHYPLLLLPPVPEIQQPMVAFLDAEAQVSPRQALQLNLQNPKQIVLGPSLDPGPNHQGYRIDNSR